MAKMQVGSRVVGKSKKTKGKVGVVRAVRKESRQQQFDVLWSCGTLETVFSRSITLAAVQDAVTEASEYTSTRNESVRSFTDLLTASAVLDSSSSSNDESTFGEEETSECTNDNGGGTVHERVWTPCSSVTVGPGSHIRPRRPLLLWPQSLVLGDNKLIDYSI
ncbi:hypothetical protein GN244_ATG05382 [Phytophthora infestans]|uniref:Uncharacterized protein n=1 Tax=Phytophthora infestans TaxID=4787 RepID=A0A833W4V0_PHYIN|nr:hypothetical protein GN244_ATG05382 [Phytophthora infestans]